MYAKVLMVVVVLKRVLWSFSSEGLKNVRNPEVWQHLKNSLKLCFSEVEGCLVLPVH